MCPDSCCNILHLYQLKYILLIFKDCIVMSETLNIEVLWYLTHFHSRALYIYLLDFSVIISNQSV